MARIKWDEIGEHFYETGVSKGVLYPVSNNTYPAGVAWNGLTGVTEKPSGAETTDLYADNAKYLSLMSAEKFGATIEAYTYPEEFEECDGSATLVKGVVIGQQPRKAFGISYVTQVGNDSDGADHGYKIHIIYGCLASPSEKGYSTINDSPEAITFSWEVSTTPVMVTGFDKPTATVVIDSRDFSDEAGKAKLAAFEDVIWGKDGTSGAGSDPRLPLPDEIKTLLTVG